MPKRKRFRKATLGMLLSWAVACLLWAGPAGAEKLALQGAVGRAAPSNKRPTALDTRDDPGGLIWVSREAAYEVSSQSSDRYSPLPGLLTGQGRLYAVPGAPDSFAFHTTSERAPHIIIALKGAPAIQRLFIENRRGGGFEARASGLTVWVSGDKKSWKRVWTAQRVQGIIFFSPVWYSGGRARQVQRIFTGSKVQLPEWPR